MWINCVFIYYPYPFWGLKNGEWRSYLLLSVAEVQEKNLSLSTYWISLLFLRLSLLFPKAMPSPGFKTKHISCILCHLRCQPSLFFTISSFLCFFLATVSFTTEQTWGQFTWTVCGILWVWMENIHGFSHIQTCAKFLVLYWSVRGVLLALKFTF